MITKGQLIFILLALAVLVGLSGGLIKNSQYSTNQDQNEESDLSPTSPDPDLSDEDVKKYTDKCHEKNGIALYAQHRAAWKEKRQITHVFCDIPLDRQKE